MFANLVCRGLGGKLIPTAGLGKIIQIIELPAEYDNVGNEPGAREILLKVPDGHIIVLLMGMLIIMDDDLD